MGRRVAKKKNDILLKQWIYRDALKPVAELDGTGALVSEFVYWVERNVPDYVRRVHPNPAQIGGQNASYWVATGVPTTRPITMVTLR
jgi:hypothetical protein